jgi:hypothetical protein
MKNTQFSLESGGRGFKSLPARHGQTPPVLSLLSTPGLFAFSENFVSAEVAYEFKAGFY